MAFTKAYFTNTSIFSQADIFQKYYKTVSEYRKAKIDRLKLKGKENSLGVEVLLKKALDDFGVPKTTFDREISVSKDGKPSLKNHPEVHFNLSHAGNVAFCVISEYECGCDVELINPKKFNLNLVKRFFSKEELAQIENATDDSAKASLFFDYWTRKEAYGKMTGDGVNYIIGEKTDFSNLDAFEKDNDCSFKLFEDLIVNEEKYKLCAVCGNPEHLPTSQLFEMEIQEVSF